MTGASVAASSEDSIAGASAVIGSDLAAARVDFTLCFAVSIFFAAFSVNLLWEIL
ncbi:hypothetical protein [Macrococcoides caseolyticum]|uniref:hypothetical protein n=1 Tax=Macrococcoides caseolyticum TaxID=69966 RepID=UPI0012FF2C38|nr:hypothetical protein [Macrococcus caseolyticus]